MSIKLKKGKIQGAEVKLVSVADLTKEERSLISSVIDNVKIIEGFFVLPASELTVKEYIKTCIYKKIEANEDIDSSRGEHLKQIIEQASTIEDLISLYRLIQDELEMGEGMYSY